MRTGDGIIESTQNKQQRLSLGRRNLYFSRAVGESTRRWLNKELNYLWRRKANNAKYRWTSVGNSDIYSVVWGIENIWKTQYIKFVYISVDRFLGSSIIIFWACWGKNNENSQQILCNHKWKKKKRNWASFRKVAHCQIIKPIAAKLPNLGPIYFRLCLPWYSQLSITVYLFSHRLCRSAFKLNAIKDFINNIIRRRKTTTTITTKAAAAVAKTFCWFVESPVTLNSVLIKLIWLSSRSLLASNRKNVRRRCENAIHCENGMCFIFSAKKTVSIFIPLERFATTYLFVKLLLNQTKMDVYTFYMLIHAAKHMCCFLYCCCYSQCWCCFCWCSSVQCVAFFFSCLTWLHVIVIFKHRTIYSIRYCLTRCMSIAFRLYPSVCLIFSRWLA